MDFKLHSKFQPAGDQPQAIEKLVKGLEKEKKHQTLLGVTGSGKTFTMANIVAQQNKPTLVLAHNKTLAAQLCQEFRDFFPDNAVCYFVSYYDYYQPEAYMAASDTYIEKDASINDEINKYRHQATQSLLTRNDVLIVASVSCIYGLGPVEDYKALAITINKGEKIPRDQILRKLTDIQFTRSHLEFKQGMFHVLGDSIEIFPSSQDTLYKLDFWGDDIETIHECDSFTGEIIRELDTITVFPAKHNVTTDEKIKIAVEEIRKEKEAQVKHFKDIGKIVEAERVNTRTEYDLEMLLETGYVSGIENYVRYFGNREPGKQPATLLDYFPKDSLFFIDESHISIPQIGGMFGGNKSRKDNLINHGFRLPSAYDNRPLTFQEFEGHVNQAIYVSATPNKYEYANTKKEDIIEQIIRPTGLLDPIVSVRCKEHQIDDLMNELQVRLKKKERVLITTLTKKQAEDLTEFLKEANIKVEYLHSDVDTMQRIEILRQLRVGDIDIIVGINLLREGLDLPEVSLVAILDADKEGFLRSRDALIQTIGRTARHLEGTAILYSRKSTEKDKELGHARTEDGLHLTKAMKAAIDETRRRRIIQQEHNEKHGITPQSIKKAINSIVDEEKMAIDEARKAKEAYMKKVPKEEIPRLIHAMETQMQLEVENLNFEKAGELRDEIDELQAKLNK
ncbi:MAG: excinuclease ABC subunit UvrB [Candidatus Gracilibacteria bacterium]|nr:excinuclease ABC subunit UvrB [Candidatus Gracilibacteria bacterium]